MQLSDFCIKIDRQMSKETCDSLVNLFNTKKEYHKRIQTDKEFEVRTQLSSAGGYDLYNFSQYSDHNRDLYNVIVIYTIQGIQEYQSKIKIAKQFCPAEYGYESLRIKCYNAETNDHFNPHVDILDYNDARRYLTLLWFLNDADGGEFSFYNFDMKFTPKKGTLVMFPSVWLFPHKTALLNSGKKYIMQTYAHYLD